MLPWPGKQDLKIPGDAIQTFIGPAQRVAFLTL